MSFGLKNLRLTIAFLAAMPGWMQLSRAQDQVPSDWSGRYTMARGADLRGFQPVNQRLDDVVMKALQPWARLKIAETNGVADDTGAVCNLAGLFRHLSVLGNFYWIPGDGKIIMAASMEVEIAGVRRIYLNRGHPPNLPHTWLGDSVGHWEGDTLVVDTTGFNDKSWLMSGMEPHTEELHVVERFRQVAPGLLEIQTTVDDRKALTTPYTYTRYEKKVNSEAPEQICNGDPGEQAEWVGFQKSAIKHPPTLAAAAENEK